MPINRTTADTLLKQSQEIHNFYTVKRRMPSYSEICTICNIKSKNTAHTLVQKLIAKGLVERDSSGKIIPLANSVDPIKGSLKNTTTRSSRKFAPEAQSIRLLGLVEAGFPTPSEESLHEQISLDDWIIGKREASFMLKVKGDSMKDAGILDGDMVIVERTNTPKVGQIVVADVDGSYTMKYLRKDPKGRFFLEPANTHFRPIYPKENLNINAVVRGVVRKY